MHSTILMLAALGATVAADLGSGIIINNCDYDVALNNVPSADGVHTIYSTTLAANGGSYSQQWTSLANNNGWSMKLNPVSDANSIMQFEYTYSDLAPTELWFDLSYVNGQPFENDWFISSNSLDCVVKQTAYNDPTDDANGMQPMCSPDTDVTVTLCSSTAGTLASAVSSVANKVAAVTEPTTSSTSTTEEAAPTTTEAVPTTTSTTEEAAPTTTEAAPTTTSTTEEAASTTAEGSQAFVYLDSVASSTPSAAEPTTTTAAGSQAFNYLQAAASTTNSPSPTTLATLTTSTSVSTKDNGYVVTEIDTVVATDVVTVYGHGGHHDKRHAHRHGHRHARN